MSKTVSSEPATKSDVKAATVFVVIVVFALWVYLMIATHGIFLATQRLENSRCVPAAGK